MKQRRVPETYSNVWITLHDLFDACEGQGRVSAVRWGFILSGIDLALPETLEKLLKLVTVANKGLVRLPRLRHLGRLSGDVIEGMSNLIGLRSQTYAVGPCASASYGLASKVQSQCQQSIRQR